VLLIHHNASSIEVVDNSGNTALHWASVNGHDSVSNLFCLVLNVMSWLGCKCQLYTCICLRIEWKKNTAVETAHYVRCQNECKRFGLFCNFMLRKNSPLYILMITHTKYLW